MEVGLWQAAYRTVRDRSVLRAFVTGKLVSSSQKKHKPITRLWSRMNLFLRKTGIWGPGTSAVLSLRSTIIPGTLARMASFRCWCAWEPGTAASWPSVHTASPAGGAGGPVWCGGGEWLMARCPWAGEALEALVEAPTFLHVPRVCVCVCVCVCVWVRGGVRWGWKRVCNWGGGAAFWCEGIKPSPWQNLK